MVRRKRRKERRSRRWMWMDGRGSRLAMCVYVVRPRPDREESFRARRGKGSEEERFTAMIG